MKIAIIGTGYAGLVSGTCFADLGHDVTCVDVVEEKIAGLKRGVVPIYEPGLEELCKRNTQEGRLHFTTDLADAVREADAVFLALPTPQGEDGSADLSYVLDVADKLGPLIKAGAVIVDKSTVPVGTAELVREHIARGATEQFDVVSNPEFLREGDAIRDFLQPDRIVVGVSSKRARKIMEELYSPLVRAGYKLLIMDERSAELTKYAANSFLALKINYINEIANICERVGADVEAVRQGLGSDERIGMRFLNPSIGYGGSCFPKDSQALVLTAQQHGYDFSMLQMVIDHNKARPQLMTERLAAYFGGHEQLRDKTIALWGLAFKAETDDIRQSPAVAVAQALIAAGARVQAYDPEAVENTKRQLGEQPLLTYAPDEFTALRGADALVVATEWPQFSAVSLAQVKQALKNPVIFDGRNMFGLEAMQAAGFYYESIGRKTIRPTA
ncbi:MAG TPA: UDP-glucose/GDP-mannose dehydrogenase family protein [Candidatus Saccharimonadales bacterium]|nr:UDP-glucose/GDP-mannose dehydrogenase family protein [Candidatus Saccharimonadales bacterium]